MREDSEYYVQKFKKNRRIVGIDRIKKILSIDQSDIDNFYTLIDQNKAYFPIELKFKSNGQKRKVFNPHPNVRYIQEKINNRLFNPKGSRKGVVKWPFYLYGSIPNYIDQNNDLVVKNYIECAKNHCLNNSILKVDISDFFENIHHDNVFYVFKDIFRCCDDVSKLLADFCTFENRTPQGALTSSFIASAILYDLEPMLVRRLERKGLVYTRLVDDITVSSRKSNFNFDMTIAHIKNMLLEKDFPINEDKLYVSSHSSATTLVHGLRVNFKEPRLPIKEVSRIRASVKNMEDLAEIPGYRTTRDYRKDFNRCLGRVNRLHAIGHNQARSLIIRLGNIKPLPSYKDVVFANKLVGKLEYMYGKGDLGYFYMKKYNLASNEINIIKRSFKKQSSQLRNRLRKIRA